MTARAREWTSRPMQGGKVLVRKFAGVACVPRRRPPDSAVTCSTALASREIPAPPLDLLFVRALFQRLSGHRARQGPAMYLQFCAKGRHGL